MDRVVAASVAIGAAVGTKEADNAGAVGETSRAEQMIQSGNFPKDPAVERILVTAIDGPLDRAAAEAAADDAAARMRALHDVATVDGPVPSPDGAALMLSVQMTGDPATAVDRVGPLLEMKQFDVGLAAAILIDATIIRAVVLPAVMTMLGST